LDEGRLVRSRKLKPIAARLGATPAQVALAWLLRRSPVMAPIPGTSSVEHLEEDLAATELQLTDAEFASLSGAAESSL
ncbi:MAG: aldo/keto reductase, partial [Thermoleophilia bacterium]